MDAYSKVPRICGMENINTEKVIDELDMFQAIFGKVDTFSSWDMERTKTYSGMQFIFKEFLNGISVCLV